ncbi:MAG: cytidine deaminase [Coxiella sp. RIFCSPHIGHO2_12_FULL_42_15]|nr:MAG: cytidine deaminase [Coxiella sp. RIFCSPHIGHO2_12_FULL_42_15]
MEKQLYQWALEAQQKAYAPYSHFRVGVCLQASNGEYFSGCNIENASYGLTLCAEAIALGCMVMQGPHRIQAVAIVSDADDFCPPCGGYRQRLSEFANPDTVFFLFNQAGQQKKISMQALFPFPFNKNFLGDV